MTTLQHYLYALSALHFLQEQFGGLWKSFAEWFNIPWLAKISWGRGLALITAPALAAQLFAIHQMFSDGLVDLFWLGVQTGLSVGDAVLSHLLPSAGGNPGGTTAWLYLVNSLLLVSFYSHEIRLDTELFHHGFLWGAGFFAAVFAGLGALGLWNRLIQPCK